MRKKEEEEEYRVSLGVAAAAVNRSQKLLFPTKNT